MKVEELIQRARSNIGKKIKYRLGGGKLKPVGATCADEQNSCDCSAFVCWCLQISKHTDHPLYVKYNDGWINTNAIVHDATNSTGFFVKLDKPKVGCLIVYASGAGGRKIGHVGVVTKINTSGDEAASVIHCSSGSYRNKGDAILETEASIFMVSGHIYAWYEGLED